MRAKFWGTRGSIAKPGSSTARYGGNTSCVELRSARGALIITDCGTGAHGLGQALMAAGTTPLRGHILISHTHWDHIQGLPFFAPLFVPGNVWDIYGPRGLGQSLRETLAGQMQHSYFPVTLEQFGASVRYHDLVEGTFDIEDVKISTTYLNHTALTLGYRLEADGVSVVYCCDHEPYSRALAGGDGEIDGQDGGHAKFVHGADLLIHDAQYTAAEYPAKIGWGHSTVEYVVRLSEQAKVKRLALSHHDPLRDDDAMDRVLAGVRAGLADRVSPLEVFAAAEGTTVEVEGAGARTADGPADGFQAVDPVEPALVECCVLLGIATPSLAAAASEAVISEGIRTAVCADIDQARRFVVDERPSFVILEHETGRIDGLAICRAIRQAAGDQLPVVMIAAQEDQAGTAAGVTDWLITPFSQSYARTKIRAWVLRTASRWARAPVPAGEERRLASLRALGILDTAPEERFDRITRVATALFDVPIALISVVDENRQWFKSCQGLGVNETSREVSFCAHVVYHREPLIVVDALQDARFADNPLVVGPPRIRFYGGYPLILGDGSCVGTLCLLDTRPRTLERADMDRLRDLADMVLHELRGLNAETANRAPRPALASRETR